MKIIIGNTGLIGKTICEKEKFDLYFNSKNIDTYNEYVNNGSELFLSCLPATKWMINKNPLEDLNNIMKIINIISKKEYSKITLISTIDVYDGKGRLMNENDLPCIDNFNYGNNRYLFEILVTKLIKTNDLKIFRLPALFNKHIKKNILYDLLNDNNIEQINPNSWYQWYNLDNLTDDIKKYSKLYPKETIFNLFGEPIETNNIISLFPQHKDKIVHNWTNNVYYDFKTKFTDIGYISTELEILEEIKKFINEFSSK